MPSRHSHAFLSLVVGQDRRDISDKEVAVGLVAGETWAVPETWLRFAPMVIVRAERCLGSRSEGEAVAQEVFYRLFTKANTLRDTNTLRSFVYSFAIRRLKTELRRRKVRSWLQLEPPEAISDITYGSLDMDSRDLLRRFHSLLDRLNPRDRLVFILRRMEAMTLEEIATHMNLSTSTVKRSLGHASERLTHWIANDPGLAAALGRKGWER